MNKATNNFSGGEWSPFLDGRADLQKYDSACITLQNFRPLPWGGVTYRQGTARLGTAKYGDRQFHLVPFNYSTSLSFMIEMGDLYMRFWNRDGTPVVVVTANLSAWVSMTPYVRGNFVRKLVGGFFFAYYCIADVTSATTPDADPTHWSPQTVMELPSPFTAAQIRAVQFKQINSELRLTHIAVPPQTLTYTGLNIPWTMAATAFKYPVLRDQNAVQASVLSVAATTGATTLTASVAGTFNAGHVGSFWELQHLRPSASVILDMNNQTIGATVYSSNIPMNGAWTFTTSQFWYGMVQVQRSVDGGTTWNVIREFTAKSDQNFSTSGTEGAPQIGLPAILYRIAYVKAGAPFDAAVWVGSPPSQYAYAQATLESQDAYIAGIVQVTAFTDSQHVSALVIIPPQSTAPTYLWSEGAFSTYRGFPTAIGLYEQRLLYSGTLAQPNTIWGSVTGDFDNFQFSGNDDGAVAFQPAVCQQNPTAWLQSIMRIHLGTTGEEIIMASGNFDEPLTPSNVTMRAQSFYGSAPLQPLQMQNSLLFVERNGFRVREMRELSPYVAPTDFSAPDLTLMSEHITQPGIVEMDFGRLPDPLAYFIRSDGVLAVCTYNREQNVTAWARYVTSGLYETVAAIYGSPADVVWVGVARTIAGVTSRFIEAFTTDPAEYPNIETNVMLDCATTVTVVGSPISFVGQLSYLIGATVTAVIDGAEYPGLTVVDGGVNGLLVFPDGVTAARSVRIGFPYTGQLSPMKPELVDQAGSSQGKKRRVTEVIVRMRNSLTLAFAGGPSPASFTEIPIRSPGDAPGSNNPLSAGVVDVVLPGPWPEGNDFSGQVTIQQSHPFPLTILALFVKFDVL